MSTGSPQSQPLFQGPLHWLDAMLLLAALLVLLGLIGVKGGWHQTAGPAKVAEGIPVHLTIALDRVQSSHPETLFAPEQNVELTVRNRPRGQVAVASVVVRRPKAVVSTGGGYQWIPDANRPDEANITLTLQDVADKSDDGYVAKGIKLKGGLHVTVETPDSSYPGTITGVSPVLAKTAL
ncbi:MAG: DUF4330 family protein [Vampirovibrionales bacterium]